MTYGETVKKIKSQALRQRLAALVGETREGIAGMIFDLIAE